MARPADEPLVGRCRMRSRGGSSRCCREPWSAVPPVRREPARGGGDGTWKRGDDRRPHGIGPSAKRSRPWAQHRGQTAASREATLGPVPDVVIGEGGESVRSERMTVSCLRTREPVRDVESALARASRSSSLQEFHGVHLGSCDGGSGSLSNTAGGGSGEEKLPASVDLRVAIPHGVLREVGPVTL